MQSGIKSDPGTGKIVYALLFILREDISFR